VKYSLPNIFTVSYDLSKTDQNKILDASIFKEFKATPVL